MIDRIANEMIIASHLKKTNQVAPVAEQLGYQPMLILNALYEGEKAGKLTYITKKNIFNVDKDVNVEALLVTDQVAEVREQVEIFMTHQNASEVDMTVDELRSFLPMFPELHMEIALFTSKVLATYELSDPKDKKSVYTFVTLKENEGKFWGKKQFDASKSLVKKHSKKAKS